MAGYSTTANIVLTVNGKQAQKMLSQLEQDAKRLEKGIAAAASAGDKATTRKLQRELNNTKKMMEQLKGSANSVDTTLRRLDKATPKELNRTLRQLQHQLNGLQRGSAAWDAQIAKIRAVRAELQRVNATLQTQQSMWSRMNKWLNNCQTALMGAVAAVTGLIMAGRKAVNQFAQMDEALANTRKYTGMSKEEVDKLNDTFKRMDTRTSREELNALAQEAGRLGKNTLESVQGYVEAAEIINVALVDLGDGATQTIAKLTNIFGVEKMLGTRDAMLAVGSTVNVLSQNCTASKPYLVDFAQRMAGIGSQAGLTIPQILAFAAVLDANGQKVEMSATALQKVIMNLANKNKEFAATVGLDARKLNETLKHSAKDGLLMFLEALQKMGKNVGFENATMTLAPAFKDMGLDAARVSQVLSTLAMHLDEVKWQMGEADKAFKEASSATREYTIFNNTAQASIDKAKKRVNEIAVELGEKLYPAMKHIYTSSGIFLRVLSTIVSFFIRYGTEILVATAAIAAYNIAVRAQTIYTVAAAKASALFNGSMAVMRKMLPVVQLLFTPLVNAIQYFTNGLQVNYAMQLRWRKAMAAMSIGNWTALIITAAAAVALLTKRWVENINSQIRQRREQEKLYRQLIDCSGKVADLYQQEAAQLEILYKKATDESIAKEKRIKAAEKILKLYPEQFKLFTEEAIALGLAKKKYDELTEAIMKNAEARAAAELLYEHKKEVLKLQLEKRSYTEQRQVASDERDRIRNRNKAIDARAGRSAESVTGAIAMQSGGSQENFARESTAEADQRVYTATAEMNKRTQRINVLNKAIGHLWDSFKTNETFIQQLSGSKTNIGETGPDPDIDAIDPENNPDGGSGAGSQSDRFAEEKEWREKEEALARISYATGQADYIAHTKRMNEIAVGFYKKQLAHTDLSEKERLEITAQWREELAKLDQNRAAGSLDSEFRDYNMKMAELKQFYADGKISKETYDCKVEELEISHQEKIVAIHKNTNKRIEEEEERRYQQCLNDLRDQLDQGLISQKDYNRDLEELERIHAANINNIRKGQYEADNKLNDLKLRQRQRRQKETEDKEKRLAQIKQDYFGDNPQEAQEKYDADVKLLDIVYQREIQAAAGNAAEKLRIDEAYEKAKLVLKKKYGLLAQDEESNSLKGWIGKSAEWLESEVGKAVLGAVDTVTSGMSAIFSQLSELTKADLEIQTAAIEKRYDTEISRAEGNSYKVKKLEKQKEQEIAKAKNEANRKMFAMQVFQAVAQTATNAINAYGAALQAGLFGLTLAPIAATMAIAAGMIQISTIKKQQQASASQGYAEGGFTPKGRKDEAVGIVHAGEWVASQKLVNNPQTRPLLEALDRAQRTNTIGSIRMADVSRSITAPVVSAAHAQAVQHARQAPQQTVVIEQDPELAETMRKLGKRLDEPFVTVNTVTGDSGIRKAQENYERLIRNKTPKSKR